MDGLECEYLCRPLSYIPISGHNASLPSNHDVGGPLETINEGLTTAVQVVKLTLQEMNKSFILRREGLS